MAKYFTDGRTPVGVVYEEDGRFHYECEFCSTSYSGSDEYRLELKADNHDRDCNRKPNKEYNE